MSLRSSERGLKLLCMSSVHSLSRVAPFVGAWIEISKLCLMERTDFVAPFVGAWIEIWWLLRDPGISLRSLRSSERGLKFGYRCGLRIGEGRSVRRSVD